ncbi:hypothetical protein As57867_001552, partial [Aphanomyces stellatus]
TTTSPPVTTTSAPLTTTTPPATTTRVPTTSAYVTTTSPPVTTTRAPLTTTTPPATTTRVPTTSAYVTTKSPTVTRAVVSESTSNLLSSMMAGILLNKNGGLKEAVSLALSESAVIGIGAACSVVGLFVTVMILFKSKAKTREDDLFSSGMHEPLMHTNYEAM